MIDFHTHILPKVDDGSENIEMSLRMIEASHEEGVDYICSTPHFIKSELEINKKDYDEALKILRQSCPYLQPIILSGLEIYINPDLPELYREGLIWGLNNTSYILIELPMQQFPIYTEKVFYRLRLDGLIPIIAHPERNLNILNNPKLLLNLVEQGTIVQMNSGSLLGLYGSKIKKFAEELVSKNLVHLLGSDTHNITNRPARLKEGYHAIKRLNLPLYQWIIENETKIVNNMEIELPELLNIKTKKSYFFNLFGKNY